MANEYRAKSFADAFRQARRDIGGGGKRFGSVQTAHAWYSTQTSKKRYL